PTAVTGAVRAVPLLALLGRRRWWRRRWRRRRRLGSAATAEPLVGLLHAHEQQVYESKLEAQHDKLHACSRQLSPGQAPAGDALLDCSHRCAEVVVRRLELVRCRRERVTSDGRAGGHLSRGKRGSRAECERSHRRNESDDPACDSQGELSSRSLRGGFVVIGTKATQAQTLKQ